jgi:Asp-tRNA(Asn)/Glu-tRNA(Gln) amidotransferase B subunit
LALVGEFFASDDPRVLRSAYRLRDFVDLAQYLRIRDGKAQDGRMRANVNAAARAIRGGRKK